MNGFGQKKVVKKFTKAGIVFAVFWILFLLSRSLWQNFTLRQSVSKLHEQISQLKTQKKDLENLNLYYRSDSFRELEARKRLGLKKIGEKMVILPISPAPSLSSFPEDLEKEKEKVAGVSTPSKVPNWLLWWQYFTSSN